MQKTIEIIKREWENIRLSLELCGDIGEFNYGGFVNGSPKCPSLFRNINMMEHSLPRCGYCTYEAAYVFDTLAPKAGERLGLRGEYAKAFGGGYSWIRTGWFDINGSMEDSCLIKQMFFLKLFSPFGGNLTSWDFGSPIAKTKLKLVFSTFLAWQSDPRIYNKDVSEYSTQIEPIRRGLSLSPILSNVFAR